MTKIFHIITHFDVGGAERVALNIAKSKSDGFDYHILEVVRGQSDFTEKLIEEFKENKITYHRSSIRNKKLAILFFPIKLLIKYFIEKPEVIHTHTEIPDVSYFIFQKIASVFKANYKHVRTIHNTQLWTSWKKLGSKIEPVFIKKSINVSISESTKQCYHDSYNSPNLPIIYNGLSEAPQKTFPDIKKDKINILFAGRLEYQKGIDELISIIKEFANDERFHFFIVGDGSLKSKLNKELAGINNITFYKAIYNIVQYLSSFDYLLMPSNFEGLPLMSIEASFNKTPVIANNCAGLNETIPKDWPLVVNNNSVNEFVEILDKRIFQIKRNELGNYAYNFVKERFSIQKMQKQYEQLYNESRQ